MSTDLEADLRREFDAASPPSNLTYSTDSVLRQGSRTIRRRRIIAAGSAALAVAVVATGASLFARPDEKALPLPASGTAATGIVRAQAGIGDGHYDITFNRDTRVKSNVHYFFTPKDGRRREVGSSSTGKPGQKPDAVWWTGIVDGRPFTIGLVPSTAGAVAITFADGGVSNSDSDNFSHSTFSGVGFEELKGTGFSVFYVDYTPGDPSGKGPRRFSEIASIRWTGPTGIVDGIEGDHRLSGRTLTMGKGVSVEVVLRPGDDGRITVFGRTLLGDLRVDGVSNTDLSLATTDLSGAAVVTGRQPLMGYPESPESPGDRVPIAAGILPPGAKEIGVVLVSNDAATGLAVHERLPDGRVIFALKADWGQSSDPRKASIRAITWTNADGTPGRIDVTQKNNFTGLGMQG